MSGGFEVVAIVSSIVQLVDFTSKVVSRLHEFQAGTSEAPKSLRHLKAELPVLEHSLNQIKLAIDRSILSNACVTALLPTIRGVDESLQEIDAILAKTLPKQGDGRARRVVKSVGSVWNDGNVEKIRSTLQNYVGTLTFYFVAPSSTLHPKTDTKLDKIRRWLSAPDPSVNYQKALALRQPNTGHWLVESDLFRQWTVNASTVWLHGIPGCGKTVLSSTLLEELLKLATDNPGKAVAYFYFDFNDEAKQDPNLMIRSLLSQLSQQCVKASASLDTLLTSCDNGRKLDGLTQNLKHVHDKRLDTWKIVVSRVAT